MLNALTIITEFRHRSRAALSGHWRFVAPKQIVPNAPQCRNAPSYTYSLRIDGVFA